MTKEMIKRYFEENDKIQDFCYVEDREVNGQLHVFEYNYTKEDILKIFLSFDDNGIKMISDKMVRIDFANGDMNQFFEWVLIKYCNVQIETALEELK